MLDPIVTPSSLEVSPLHVAAVILATVVIGLIGVGIRRFLIAYTVELGVLWRDAAPRLAAVLLRRRTMPSLPWFCATCHSRNGEAASCCYSCGARRQDAEAAVPDAEEPAGASAGRSQRSRTGH